MSWQCPSCVFVLLVLLSAQWTAACTYVPSDNTDPCECVNRMFINIDSTEGTAGHVIANFNTSSAISLSQPCGHFNYTDNKLILQHDVNDNCDSPLRCAYACNGEASSSEFIVNVNFVDTLPPTFDKSLYTVNIDEEMPVGTSVFGMKTNATATDPDCKSTLYFDMNDTTNNFDFPNANDAIIKTKVKLDYDSLPVKQFNLTILAYNDQTASATLQIVINDIDDQNPSFTPEKYLINVTEERVSEAWLVTSPPLRCLDQDTGINATVKYAFKVDGSYTDKCSHIQINADTGQLKVISVYDRESLPADQLTVWCYQENNNTKTATTTLNINVIDINDNAPVFHPTQYNVTINENTVGYVTMVTASDEDVGINGEFSYDIIDDNGMFTVNAKTGEITIPNTSVVDRETHPTVELMIRAVDKEGNYSSNNATVTITLIDLNDNSPIFAHSHFAFPFNTSAVGTVVGQVYATDADEPGSGNSNVTYSNSSVWVTNSNTPTPTAFPLSINPMSGQISVEGTVSQGSEYNLLIRACDNPAVGSSRRCNSVQVICVFNPNATLTPVTIDQDMAVTENVPVGTLIARLNKTGDYYEINMADNFSVDPLSNMLSTKIQLDRESRDQYNIQVNVSSRSLGALGTVNVHLQILDANDHAPLFGQDVYYFSLPKTASNDVIGTFDATDDDIRDNGNITFSFHQETHSKVFQLDPVTGQVRVKSTPGQTFYKLLVLATDHGTPPLQDSVPAYIAQLETTDNGLVTITVSSSPAYIEENRKYFQEKIAEVLEIDSVTITDVNNAMTSRSSGGILRSSLTFKASNGSDDIPVTELQRQVMDQWTGIQDLFRQALVPGDTSNEGMHPAEISLIAVSVVVLVGGIICMLVVCKQYDAHIKNHRLYDHLSRRSTMYDSQELRIEFGDEISSQLPSRVSTFRGTRRNNTDETELEGSFGLGYINTGFSGDEETSPPKTPTWSTSGTPRIPKWSTSDSLKDAMMSLDDLSTRLNAEDNISRVTSMSRSRRSMKSQKSEQEEITPDSIPVYANVTSAVTSAADDDDDYITPIADYPVDVNADTSVLKYDQMDLTMARDDDVKSGVTNDASKDEHGGIAENEGEMVEEATAF